MAFMTPATNPGEASFSGGGLLRIKSNKDLDAAEKAKEAIPQNQTPFIISLQNHISAAWSSAKTNKWVMEEKLLKSQRQRRGKYDPDDLSQLRKFGGSQIFMMITNVKCRAIESWMKDVLLPAGEKPWSIDPTPVPTLPDDFEEQVAERVTQEVMEVMAIHGPEIVTEEMVDDHIEDVRDDMMQEYKKRAERTAHKAEMKLDDILTEGNFYEALEDFLKDLASYHTAFMKGPIIRMKKKLVWEDGAPTVKKVIVREFQRVSPYDIYPSPGARSLQDGYICERMRLRRTEIQKMRGVPGFNTGAIDAVLLEQRSGGLTNWLWTDQERANLEDRPNEQEDPEPIIECVEYNGPVQGQKLLDWGMNKKEVPNPALDYEVTAWMVDRWVIMARLNKHPLGRRPYYGASFEQTNDSIWGISPPELMEDCQRVCNATARAMVNNMAIASGPQVEVHEDRVDPREDIEDIYPWKVWRTKSDERGTDKPAVYFFQPNTMTDTLMRVYEYYFKQAGEQLGVPAYEHGSPNVGGAGKTAHGLAMLMTSSSKIMKEAIGNVDRDLIKPLIYEVWVHAMLYDDDFPKEGDINVVARASEYLVIAEQLQVRRAEFLALTNNPVDHRIIGDTGRAKVLREVTKGLKMQSEDIVPDEDDLNDRQQAILRNILAMEEQMGMQPGIEGPGGQGVPGEPGGQLGPPGSPTQFGINLNAAQGYQGTVPGPGPEPSQVVSAAGY